MNAFLSVSFSSLLLAAQHILPLLLVTISTAAPFYRSLSSLLSAAQHLLSFLLTLPLAVHSKNMRFACYSFLLTSASVWSVSITQSHAFSVAASHRHNVASSSIHLPTSLAVSTSSQPSSTSTPQLGSDGLYHLESQEQHAELMKTVGQNNIVVLKVYAPWCRACKALEAKFLQISHDPKYNDLPLVWATLTIQHNKEFIKQLGVLALPTIQFYLKGKLVETFPCGPSTLG